MRIQKAELEKLHAIATDGLNAKDILMKNFSLGYIRGRLRAELGLPIEVPAGDVVMSFLPSSSEGGQ